MRILKWIALAGIVLCAALLAGAAVMTGGHIRVPGTMISSDLGNFTGIAPLSSTADTKIWAWDGGDALEIDAPASVKLVPGGPARVIVKAPPEALAMTRFGGGKLATANDSWNDNSLDVTIQGVKLSTIEINGAAKLALGHLDQDKLHMELNGAAAVSGEGRADDLSVEISGASSARLGKLVARTAHVEISGAGSVDVAPTEKADLEISGAGKIRLTTTPKHVSSDISGFGSVVNASGHAINND